VQPTIEGAFAPLAGFVLGKGKLKGEGGERVKRILTVLVTGLVMVAMLAVMAAPAFADRPAAKNGGKGQPVLNGGGNCPTGLQSGNQGAQNKCDR
jgi:hypothetical protein